MERQKFLDPSLPLGGLPSHHGHNKTPLPITPASIGWGVCVTDGVEKAGWGVFSLRHRVEEELEEALVLFLLCLKLTAGALLSHYLRFNLGRPWGQDDMCMCVWGGYLCTHPAYYMVKIY